MVVMLLYGVHFCEEESLCLLILLVCVPVSHRELANGWHVSVSARPGAALAVTEEAGSTLRASIWPLRVKRIQCHGRQSRPKEPVSNVCTGLYLCFSCGHS